MSQEHVASPAAGAPATTDRLGGNRVGYVRLIPIAKVPMEAPWRWLGRGFRDMARAPLLSVAYGAVFALIAVLLLLGLWYAGVPALILPMAGGFLLVGPIMAAGLYRMSSLIERGQKVTLRDTLLVNIQSPGQLAFMGVALMIAFFAWVEIALLLFMLVFGPIAMPPVPEFIQTLLLEPRGLVLLTVGTFLGAVIAAIIFASTVVSIPLLMVREVDVVTAIVTSLRAVAINPGLMILWAILIAVIMALGFALLFAGLLIAFPLIGHATWHAFRDVVPDEDKLGPPSELSAQAESPDQPS
ncbi:DUF2189 domain-containing protein [Dichotomicrobium thermohalophilum]|uniref:Putative membrane protein n=1 Tax=Dichotomicrobium thermohalophilum TaxID=933063 RepID=A0A397PH29_9HYPH|nr:DUF2189 domain-containing protein [Dichotomicrobium thermohalophilum]RIA47803.1 putative membrane protein [Dichotomicrobium thermohalophilum]